VQIEMLHIPFKKTPLEAAVFIDTQFTNLASLSSVSTPLSPRTVPNIMLGIENAFEYSGFVQRVIIPQLVRLIMRKVF
jgi:hypothetical protein